MVWKFILMVARFTRGSSSKDKWLGILKSKAIIMRFITANLKIADTMDMVSLQVREAPSKDNLETVIRLMIKIPKNKAIIKLTKMDI